MKTGSGLTYALAFLVVSRNACESHLLARPVLEALSTAPAQVQNPRTASGTSATASLDGTGRHVAFYSDATDLSSAGVLFGRGDVYLRYLSEGVTRLVSVSRDGIHAGSGLSWQPQVSRDGNRVYFLSEAENLLKDETTDGNATLYVRDLEHASTRRLSPAAPNPGGVREFLVATDESSVIFLRPAQDLAKPTYFRFWLTNGATEVVAGPVQDLGPERLVGDRSLSTLCFHQIPLQTTPKDGAVPTDLLYIKPDSTTPSRILLPIGTANVAGLIVTANATVSGDGSTICFRTVPINETVVEADGVWRLDVDTGTVLRISSPGEATRNGTDDSSGPVVSADGSTVVYQTTTRTSQGTGGPLRVWTRKSGLQTLPARSNGLSSFDPSDATEATLSPDGSRLAFVSTLANPEAGVPAGGTPHVFVRTLDTGATQSLGTIDASEQPNLQFSDDGTLLCYESTTPAPGIRDLNEQSDVMLASLADGTVQTVSVASPVPAGAMPTGNRGSTLNPYGRAVSDDGRMVVFETDAADLVPNDSNGVRDAMVRDRATGITTALATDSQGRTVPEGSRHPVVSSDGSYAAFLSSSTALVPGDTNRSEKIFIRNLRTGRIELASILPNGSGTEGKCSNVRLSWNGRRIQWEYSGPGLWADDYTQPHLGLLLRDLDSATTTLLGWEGTVDAASDGTARLDDSGTTSVYSAWNTSLLFLRTSSMRRAVSLDPFVFGQGNLELSGDGHRLVATGKSGFTGKLQLFWFDLDTQTKHLLFETTVNPLSIWPVAISRNGSRIAYAGRVDPAGNELPNRGAGIWIYEIATDRWISTGIQVTGGPAIFEFTSLSFSNDGKLLAFQSREDLASAGDSNGTADVYVLDLDLGVLTLASRSPMTGNPGSLASAQPQLSGDGRTVVFESFSNDFVAGDLNDDRDLFATSVPQWLQVDRVSLRPDGQIELHWWIPAGTTAFLEESATLSQGGAWTEVSGSASTGAANFGSEHTQTLSSNGVERFWRIRIR